MTEQKERTGRHVRRRRSEGRRQKSGAAEPRKNAEDRKKQNGKEQIVPQRAAGSKAKSECAGSAHPKHRRVFVRYVSYLVVFLLSVCAGYAYIARYHNAGTVSTGAAATGGVTILENCNIREAAGTASEVIGGGKAGEIYEYAGRTEYTGEEKDSAWYGIYYEDTVGWVSEAVAVLKED